MKTRVQVPKKEKAIKRQPNGRLLLFMVAVGTATLVAAVLAARPLVDYIGGRLFA